MFDQVVKEWVYSPREDVEHSLIIHRGLVDNYLYNDQQESYNIRTISLFLISDNQGNLARLMVTLQSKVQIQDVLSIFHNTICFSHQICNQTAS